MPIGRNSAYMHGGSTSITVLILVLILVILVIILSNTIKIISGNVTPSFYHYQHIATAQGLKSKPFLQVSMIN